MAGRVLLAMGLVTSLLVMLLVALVHTPGSAAPPEPKAFIHPDVYKALRKDGTATFIVYLRDQVDMTALEAQVRGLDRWERRRRTVASLQALADRTQPALLTWLRKPALAEHVQEVQRLWIVNALVVTGDAKALDLLARHPAVRRILPDRVRELPSTPTSRAPLTAWHLRLIEATRVHQELGITGRGVVVANIDTGVEWTIPSLEATYRGREGDHNYNWFDVTGTFPDAPGDDYGHGTATMSLIAAQAEDIAIGVAPGVRWIAVKAFDARGRTRDAWLHRAFQWILAPTDLNGKHPDPSRAPDIVSNSWGTPNGGDETFLPDIQALRVAGIIPVFAAGNSGEQGDGTINAPAAYPNVLAVGATDPNDRLADFSSRGPTPDNRLKPDLTAPGVNVLVQDNNGQYETSSGTSFSTPIVAGVIALMKEANPSLDYEAIYTLITRTAQDLGPPGPDMGYGWGRVNAYAAVQAARQAAGLYGQVLTPDGTPIPHAVLQGEHVDNKALRFTTTTDAAGRYRLTAPAGRYTIRVEAFGYVSTTIGPLTLSPHLNTLYDISLIPRPTYPLTITVIDSTGPITNAILRLEDTPLVVTGTAQADGTYFLRAPAGTYTLTVRTQRHRSVRYPFTVPLTRPITVTLRPAPRVLVINGDAWAGDDVRFYYTRLLNEAGFPFNWWEVRDATTVPTLSTLQDYDVVLWSHPLASPGWYVQALDMNVWPILSEYIQGGGRVLLTGPDIAYWEASYNVAGNEGEPLARLFGVRYEEDESGAQWVTGVPGDIVEGITLELNHILAYKNQFQTDVILPVEGARLIQRYVTTPPQGAGVRYTPASGRTIYLGYGLEGTDYRAAAQALGHMIEWLTQPDLALQPERERVALGDTFQVTITVRNPTLTAWRDAVLDVEADPALTPMGPTAWRLDLPPRGRQVVTTAYRLLLPLHGSTPLTLTARLRPPDDLQYEAVAHVQVHGPDLRASTADIPEAILPGHTYTATLMVLNRGSLTATTAVTLNIPSPIVITPTVPTVTLSADGRELYWQGHLPAAQEGQAQYAFQTSRDPGGPAFNWIEPPSRTVLDLGDDQVQGPFDIGFPFPLFGDTFTKFWVSSNGWLALAPPERSYPTNLKLPNPNAPAALIAPFWDDLNPSRGGTVAWYSDDTRLVVIWNEVPRFGSGGPYTFQAVLYRDGTIVFQYLRMNPPLDRATIGLQNAARDEALLLAYDAPFVEDRLAVRIDPPVVQRPGQAVIPFALGVHEPISDNTPLLFTATVRTVGAPTITRSFTTVVNPADFSPTTWESPSIWPVGRDVSTSLIVRNAGVGTGQLALSLRLPPGLTFTAGPDGPLQTRTFTWQGNLAPGLGLTLPLTVRVAADLSPYHPLTATLTLTDGIRPPRVQRYPALAARADLTAQWDLLPEDSVTGERITSTLLLWNTGNYTAEVVVLHTLPIGLDPITDALPAGVTYDPSNRTLRWQGALRPAREEYTWEDDQTTSLPFNWIEPSTAITVLQNVDDVTKGPLPLGFRMPFYDTVQEHIFINSNGWLSFSARNRRDFINRALPNPSAPGNLLAVWWDDLRVPLTGTVRFWSDEERAVVTWGNVMKLSNNAPYTFQVQFDATGVITYLYATMEGPLGSATIGLQDATGTRGVTVAHNDASYMSDRRVIRFLPPFALKVLNYPLRVTADAPSQITSTLTVLEPTAGRIILTRTVAVNVADLSDSSARLSAPTIARGETVTLTLSLRNTGNYTGTTVPQLVIPPELQVIATDGQQTASAVRWERTVGPGQSVTAYAALALTTSLPDGAPIPLVVEDPQWWRSELTLTVRAADIGASGITATAARAGPQSPITLTLRLVNTGTARTEVEWELPLPSEVAVAPNGLWASADTPPSYDPQTHSVRWRGDLPPRSQRLFAVGVQASALTRWSPEVRVMTPAQELTLTGPRLAWGWFGHLPWMTVR